MPIEAITTDDLIPLITQVIIQAQPKHLHSNILYMDYFIFANIANTSFGFTLVTFRAAVEYLRSDEIKCVEVEGTNANLKTTPSRRVVSFDDLLHVQAENKQKVAPPPTRLASFSFLIDPPVGTKKSASTTPPNNKLEESGEPTKPLPSTLPKKISTSS